MNNSIKLPVNHYCSTIYSLVLTKTVSTLSVCVSFCHMENKNCTCVKKELFLFLFKKSSVALSQLIRLSRWWSYIVNASVILLLSLRMCHPPGRELGSEQETPKPCVCRRQNSQVISAMAARLVHVEACQLCRNQREYGNWLFIQF